MAEKNQRPDPDQLLARIEQRQQRPSRGRLKIFLGYAAGVGKTYAMLESAQQLAAEGQNLLVAYLDTHGRADTEALTHGLEILPRQRMDYRGVTLEEMDLDGALARHPQIVLVDELAHTNAPGSRHAKRYQDVLELLDAGIDVHTTLNIQHLESLNDVVAQITGITVRETVPDRILDEADEIRLIDLPAEDLRLRLKEGKVYFPQQAAQAIEKFFRPGNLSALRELALRRTADRIDQQMRDYMQSHAISGPWPATDRLLVCVSPSPLSARLVRAARRLAVRLNAEWFAVYVETPGAVRLSALDRERLAQNLHLAESLGAKSVTLAGSGAAAVLVEFARSRNVTKIVVGKPVRSRWSEFWRASVVEEIIHHSGDLDIYIISDAEEQTAASITTRPLLPRQRAWLPFVYSAGLVLGATLLGFPLRPFAQPTNLVMLYLLTVVISALRLGRSPAIFASCLSVIAFNFVFVPPYYTYVIADAQYLLTFGALLGVGLIISALAAQAGEQTKSAQQRAAQTFSLLELSQDLASALDTDGIAQVIRSHSARNVDGDAILLLPAGDELRPKPLDSRFHLDGHEMSVALWVLQHGQTAGRGSDTLSGVKGAYLPLKSSQGILGVLGIQFDENSARLTPDQWRLLEALASQTGQAIERMHLAVQARQSHLLRETEKLQSVLLNSISHDLRTPLASITGALSSLREDAAVLDEDTRSELLATAWDQADQLNHLVGNLLEMTRLEAGVRKIKTELCDAQDVVGVALGYLGSRLDPHPIELQVPESLPPVPVDLVLMAQALSNLLDNAARYSPPNKPIRIEAESSPTHLLLKVIDQGPGIVAEDAPRLFEKFYRGRGSAGILGSGLGLSISKNIVEAHHGELWFEQQNGPGVAFCIGLPLTEGAYERDPTADFSG